MKKLYTFKNGPVFFGPPCIGLVRRSRSWDQGQGTSVSVDRVFEGGVRSHIVILKTKR